MEKAAAFKKELESERNGVAKDFHALPADERELIMLAVKDYKKRGGDLAATLFKQPAVTNHSPALATVINELIEAKAKSGRDSNYLKVLRIVLNQFARGRENKAVNQITLADIEQFMESKNAAYRSTLRGRMSALFRFAVRRGYAPSNLCERLETIRKVQTPPHIFTVAQMRTALKFFAEHPKGGAWFALSTGCGLRPEEAAKTTLSDINFAEGYVKVEAQTTKVRQRRVVYPRKEAMALLKACVERGAKIPLLHDAKREVQTELRSILSMAVWPKDITRHSAASYWLAEKGSSLSHVAKMLGHSERTCESHYKALVTQKEAAEFWKAVKDFKG